MSGWVNDLISALFAAVLAGLGTVVQAGLNWALGVLSTTLLASPDVTTLPQVQYAAGQAQLVANGCMALVVTVAGALAMTHGSIQDRYSLKELTPRLLIGFTLANLAIPIVRGAITFVNAVTAALVGAPFTSTQALGQIRRILTGSILHGNLSGWVSILQALALLMLIALLFTWLGRLLGLLVVAAVGPVALACHTLPATEPVAQLWWRSLGGLLLVQVLQGVTLHLAVATLLTPSANLRGLGLPVDPNGIFNLMITCYLLWLVIRIPRWVARTFGGTAGRGSSVLGNIVRVVVVQRLLGAVGLRGGHLLGRGGRAAAAAGSNKTITHLHSHSQANSHLHQHIHLHPGRPGQGRRGAASGQPRTARPHAGPLSRPGLPARQGPAPATPGSGQTSPSGTGWPPNPPPGRRPVGGQPSGTGWPTTPSPPPRPPGPGQPGTRRSAARPQSGRDNSGVNRGR
ncbi:MAG: hypothetical protein QG597_3524 [Actinomycetota bacterium]|nr:hypothetical protein [Actinomycetota bacterium]